MRGIRAKRVELPSPSNPHDCTDAHSEDQNQAALFKWLNMATRWGVDVANDRQAWEVRGFAAKHGHLPRSSVAILRFAFAVPNGAHYASERHGAAMRAKGVKRGVPDICLPVPRRPYHGLWVEMKSLTGDTTSDQKEWLAHLSRVGYRTEVVIGWRSVRDVLLDYTKGM